LNAEVKLSSKDRSLGFAGQIPAKASVPPFEDALPHFISTKGNAPRVRAA